MNATHAELIARAAHYGQVDRAGKDYIFHIKEVKYYVGSDDEDLIVVAWLHDVLEDHPEYTSVIEKHCTLVQVEALARLTRIESMPYDQYINLLADNPIARKVKIADLLHNLQLDRIPTPKAADYERCAKYSRALDILRAKEEVPAA